MPYGPVLRTTREFRHKLAFSGKWLYQAQGRYQQMRGSLLVAFADSEIGLTVHFYLL